jgi:hypothetical protein
MLSRYIQQKLTKKQHIASFNWKAHMQSILISIHALQLSGERMVFMLN